MLARDRQIPSFAREDVYRQDTDAPTPPDAVGRSGADDPGKNRLWVACPIPYGVLCWTRAVGVEPHVALNAHRGIVLTIVVGQAAWSLGTSIWDSAKRRCAATTSRWTSSIGHGIWHAT